MRSENNFVCLCDATFDHCHISVPIDHVLNVVTIRITKCFTNHHQLPRIKSEKSETTKIRIPVVEEFYVTLIYIDTA